MCRVENVTYKIGCKQCREQGKPTIYWGETSRSIFERGLEHLKGQEEEEIDNPLWKHSVNCHNNNKQKYEIEVVETHSVAMKRQISEWLLILEGGKMGPILNSKNDWGSEKLPRVVIENQENDVYKNKSKKNKKDGGSARPNKRARTQRGDGSNEWKVETNTDIRYRHDKTNTGIETDFINNGTKNVPPTFSQVCRKVNEQEALCSNIGSSLLSTDSPAHGLLNRRYFPLFHCLNKNQGES